MISEDFPICPWCREEYNYQPDGIESQVCHCGKTFLAVLTLEERQIPRADKKGFIIHVERHYETRKMIDENFER